MKNLPDISYVRTRFDNIWAGEKKLDHADHAMFDKVLRFADACVQGLPKIEDALVILEDWNADETSCDIIRASIQDIKKVLES